MITAPSTIKPKSSAPRLIRLPETRDPTMPVMVISIATGITAAVTSAAFQLPSNSNKIAITSNAPSARFFCTVAMVLSTRLVRSYSGVSTTPSGNEGLISSRRLAVARETSRLFSPISMKTVPITTSLPFWVAAPVRSSVPRVISATLPSLMETPSRLTTVMARISSRFASCPGERTRYCAPKRSM